LASGSACPTIIAGASANQHLRKFAEFGESAEVVAIPDQLDVDAKLGGG